MKTKRLTCPDLSGRYHIWHYCPVCFSVYDHSQVTWEALKKSECCVRNLKSIPTPGNDGGLEYFDVVFCKGCFENAEEEKEAVVVCEKCGRQLCLACWGTKKTHVPAPRCSNPDSLRFSEPPYSEKEMCDNCYKKEEEEDEAARDREADWKMDEEKRQ